MIWNREPVLFYAVVQAAIVLATSFGLDLSTEQTRAIYMFTLAVLSLVVRHKVSPVDGGAA